jgi:hypothetical protein
MAGQMTSSARAIVGLLALLSFGIGTGCGAFKLKSEAQINDRISLLGPEAAAFCGGWVQVWALVDTTSFQRDVSLYLKASPGDGGSWEIDNENLLVELPKNTTRRRRIKDLKNLDLGSYQSLKVPGSGSNVATWKTTVEGLEPDTGLTVYLRPFKGCDSKGIVGLNIKETDLNE